MDHLTAYRYERCELALISRGITEEAEFETIDELEAFVADTTFVIYELVVLLTFSQQAFTLRNVRVEAGERWGAFYYKWFEPMFAPLNVRLYDNGRPIHDDEYVALTVDFTKLTLEIGNRRIGGSHVNYDCIVPAYDGFKQYLMDTYKADIVTIQQTLTGMQWVCYTNMSTSQEVVQVVYDHCTFWVLLLPIK